MVLSFSSSVFGLIFEAFILEKSETELSRQGFICIFAKKLYYIPQSKVVLRINGFLNLYKIHTYIYNIEHVYNIYVTCFPI